MPPAKRQTAKRKEEVVVDESKKTETKSKKKKGKSLAPLLLFLVAAALVLFLTYDGDSDDGTKPTFGGYNELLIDLDERIDEHSFHKMVKYFSDWEEWPWEDKYVKVVPRSELDSILKNATRPMAFHFYLSSSDVHRFEFKRLFSRAARDFKNVTGREIDFYAMEIPREGRHLTLEDKKFLKYWLEVADVKFMPVNHNFVFVPVNKEGGVPPFARTIPLRDAGPQLIEDLDVLSLDRFKHLVGDDADQIKSVFKDRAKKNVNKAFYYLFAFVEEYDHFEGPAEILADVFRYDRKKYSGYQTTDMSLATYVNTEEEVKVGDIVMYRYEDEKGFILPKSLETLADIEAWMSDHAIEWNTSMRKDYLSDAAVEAIFQRIVKEDHKLLLTIVYQDNNRKNEQRMQKVADKVMKEFQGNENFFPAVILTPRSVFQLNDKLMLTTDEQQKTASMNNFAYYQCRLLFGNKAVLIDRDVSSAYTIEDMYTQIEKALVVMKDLDDDHDPFATTILEPDMDYYDADDEDYLLEVDHSEL